MPVKTLDVDQILTDSPAHPDIRRLIETAAVRIEKFTDQNPARFQGFLPSDYLLVTQALSRIVNTQLTTGNRFCEWGSGFGVVTLAAASLHMQSFGIEINQQLVQHARQLAAECQVSATFIHGSFVPHGTDDLIDDAFSTNEGELSLQTLPDDAYDELGYTIDDFDLIFAYPWPNDEELTQAIFDRFAAAGALLLTYQSQGAVQLVRKVS